MPLIVAAALAVAAGTIAAHGRPSLAVPLSVAAGLSILVGLVRRRATVWLAIGALCAAAGASAAWRSDARSQAVLPTLAERGAVEACGVVRQIRPRSIEVRIERIEQRRRSWRTNEPVRIGGDDVRRVLPGQRICATGEVVPPREGFDEAPLLMARDAVAYETASYVRLAAGSVRARFSDVAQRVLPRTQAGLLLGMTDGDTRLLGEETVEAFRTTGLAHLVAVSGSNVAVVVALVMLVARRLIRRRWIHVAVTAPFLVFFCFLTGLEPSVIRAAVTAMLVLFVAADGRAGDGIRLAAAAFVVLVGASPEILFHPGFQLSFAATLGLVLWARPLTELVGRCTGTGGVGGAVAACIGTTLAAQAAAAPLLAWHFGRIPALGGIANLLVAPLAPLVMIGGFATLSLASLVPALAWTPMLMRFPLDAVLWSGQTFADLPSASVDSSVLAGLAVAGIVAFVVARSVRGRAAVAAFVIVSLAAAGGGAIAGGTCDGIAILDVGQGTAVLLRDDDRAVLVDGGPQDGGVVADLHDAGVDDLDAVFVSHPHADHTQGLVEVLGAMDVGVVIGPVTMGWGTGRDVVRAAEAAHVPVRTTAAGESFAFGRITIDVVFPPSGPHPVRTEDAVHAHSLVLRASVEGVPTLLPGDVGAEEERALLTEDVAAPILVAPHHGSKDLDVDFIDAVGARLVLVGVGADNRYGHPAPEALRAYARHGRVFRTDRHGTVSVCTGEGGVEVYTTKEDT